VSSERSRRVIVLVVAIAIVVLVIVPFVLANTLTAD
jgi:hypothetical protein